MGVLRCRRAFDPRICFSGSHSPAGSATDRRRRCRPMPGCGAWGHWTSCTGHRHPPQEPYLLVAVVFQLSIVAGRPGGVDLLRSGPASGSPQSVPGRRGLLPARRADHGRASAAPARLAQRGQRPHRLSGFRAAGFLVGVPLRLRGHSMAIRFAANRSLWPELRLAGMGRERHRCRRAGLPFHLGAGRLATSLRPSVGCIAHLRRRRRTHRRCHRPQCLSHRHKLRHPTDHWPGVDGSCGRVCPPRRSGGRAGNRSIAQRWSLGRCGRFHRGFLDAGILDVEYLVQHSSDRGKTISGRGHRVGHPDGGIFHFLATALGRPRSLAIVGGLAAFLRDPEEPAVADDSSRKTGFRRTARRRRRSRNQ